MKWRVDVRTARTLLRSFCWGIPACFALLVALRSRDQTLVLRTSTKPEGAANMSKFNHIRNSRKFISAAILSTACFGAVAPAEAAQYNWTGGGGSLNTGWNAPANWFGGSVPGNFDDAQIHFLFGGTGSVQNIASTMYVNAVQFGIGVSTTVGG